MKYPDCRKCHEAVDKGAEELIAEAGKYLQPGQPFDATKCVGLIHRMRDKLLEVMSGGTTERKSDENGAS